MRSLILSCAMTAVWALQGCTVGPDYHRPKIAGADETGWTGGAVPGTPVNAAPWKSLGDPVLTELIQAAVAHNLDVREAQANLHEARAERDAAAGQRLPEVSAAASATRQQISANGELPVNQIPHFERRFSLFDAGFDASWEIDLWGNTRRTVEAAQRRVEAADARQRDTLLQVVAEIVRTYAEMRGSQASLSAARREAEAQSAIASLVHQRFSAGEASNLDDVRSAAQAHGTAATAAPFDASVHAAVNELALLTGRPPEALQHLLTGETSIPLPPEFVAVGLRSDVLRRRPDIQAAEADLAAATSDVGVATAQLFPTLSLLGSAGQESRHTGDFGKGTSTYYSIGPSLHWPIFAGGSIRAGIRAADARADAAAARYEKAVLGALFDSETALNRYAVAETTLREREAARAQSATALRLAQDRYHAGDGDRVDMLEAEAASAAADRAWASAAQDSLASYAALVKSLGDGWSPLNDNQQCAAGHCATDTDHASVDGESSAGHRTRS